MNPNVIENDPKKVKQYMQNFVPVNFYQVLGDSYLSQVRAVLNYSNLEYELSNPVYDKLISDLTSKTNSQAKAIAELESKYDKVLSGVNTRIDGISEFETTIGDKVKLYENTIKVQTDSLLSIESNIRASIKNVDVGGRNLIANSDLRFGYPERGDTKVTLADHALGKLISAKSNVKAGKVFGVESGEEYNTINLIEGKEYTISFYAYGSIKTLDEIKLISLSGETIKVPSITINSDLSERYSYTFTAPSTADNYGYQLLAKSTGVNSWFSYSGLKLEIGNVATDWSPNPKDLDDIQEDIYSNIKEFKQVYADENSASAEKLEQLTAKHLANKAEITEHKKVYASQYAAQAQTINEMKVNVGSNTAKIRDIDTVYADKYTAVAERATALEAKTATAQADIKDISKVTASNTQAIVDTSREMKAELGSVEVGGRNLIRNSDLANGEQLLGGATVVKGGSILGKTSTFTATTPDIAFGFKQITEDAKIPVVKNQRYTLSVYASASKNIKEINYIYLRSEDGYVQKLPNLAVDDMFAMRGSVTFIANFTSSVAAITFACTDAIAGSWFKIAGLKLEKGTKATDYSPAPEDIIGFIDKVEATYNEYVKLNVTKDKATAERFTGLEARTAVAEGSITRIDGIVATQSGTIATHNTRITTAYNNAGLAMGKANEVDVIAKRADAAAIKANTDIKLLVTSTSNEQKAQVKREEEIRTSISQQAGEIAALKGGGRNLLLQTQTGAVEGKYLTKTGVETVSTLWKITPYIPIRGELDYFTSAKGAMDYGTVQSLVFYDSSKKFIIGYAGINRKLVTSPVNAAYVRISFLKTDYPSIMFQEGNIPTKWAPAPEDLNKEIQDLQDLIGGLDFSVDQAILDGVVDQAEAKQLNVLLLQLNTEKAELAARITTFEGNTDLTPATLDQLRKYWTVYSNQHTAVVDVCNSIIELGTVSDATKLQLKTEFSLYSSALANLVTSFEKATDSVGSTRMIAVASDAEKKIAAAEAAAKVFATTEANLKRIEAEAYADGVITKEEAARIAEAKQNLADAKADSTAKSNSAAKAAKDYADAQDVKKLTDAKSYADNKASLAKQGAEAYALAQIELNTVETNAYADGIVTAEEQARIAQATTNLNAAKAEAKRLADVAELAAKNFATQKADAALALAKTDAKTKADAAQTAAQGYALAQADAKRIAAEAYADGKITTEELARIKHANDVLVEAKADSLKKANDARDSAQAYADLGLKNLVIGGRNLLITTDASIVKGKYLSATGVATASALWLITGSIPITAGYDYIISGITNLGTAPATVFYNASGAVISGLVGTKRLSFVAPAGAVSMKVSMLQTDLPLVMIENGTKASSLSVAPEDVAKYAQDAATEAQNAARAYTEAQNKLKLEEANAYADGIVTLEEAARIAQAKANLDLAKLDASGKAEKARDAAQAFATSKDTLVLQSAQTDAQKKADAAKNAAQVFATAEAEAKRVLAEAYADNVVTVEEARAIKDANDKLTLAKADATKKADDAKKAAQDFASAQDVINLTAAKADAKTKADAAQSAAQTYALQQAEAKRVIAEAYADGIVTTEEAKRIADVNAKLLLAQADATKKANDAADAAKTYADLQITNMVIGGTNLLKLSDVEVTNNAYSMKAYYFTERPSEGDDFVITIWGTLGTDRSSFNAYNSGGSISLGVLKKIKEGVYQLSGKWRIGSASNTYLQIYQFVNGRTSSSTINKIQLELGTQGTAWTLPPQELTALVQSTADAARDAAKVFATSEANAKRVEAQAYADGIVTAEEQRAIKDANAKLVLAKADADTKANAARDAAKTFATLEANRAITAAQTDATNKANAAKLAAEKFATTEAEAKQILAQAYADGKITAEEQERIKDSDAKLAAAKLDATTKANEANAAAKTFATLEANRVLGLAKTDAQTKADAAKLAAQTFATSEANAKQVLAQAYADGKITAEEKRAIKDANDKLEAAKLDATKKANDAADAAKVYSDLQLENLVIGGTNMIDNSNFATQSLAKWSNNGSVAYISIDNRDCAHLNVTNGIYQSAISKSNVVHSISFWAKAADPAVVTTIKVGFLNQVKCNETFTLTNAWKQYTYTTTAKVTVGQTFHVYSGGKRSYVTDIKVEEGGKVSTWTPSNNDIKAYADSTSLASENAAKAFATAEANAKRVLAEAYADGKVTAEEGKRIEDVNAKLVLAKADAQAKADLAAKAAKDYADTQISNIEIGGRNLMLTSDEYSRTLGRRYGGIAESILGYKDVGYVNAPKSTMYGFNQKYSESAIIGNNYTFSILATYEGAKPKNIQLYAFGSAAYTSLEGVQGMQEGKWTKLTLTRSPIASDYTGTHHMHIFTEGDAPSKVYFACAQVEKGNKASDWTPAAEDVTKSVTDLGESLKDFKGVSKKAFEDGLISKAEATTMDSSKAHLERGMKELSSRYLAVYGNAALTGTPKTGLKTSYDAWVASHNALTSYMTTATSNGVVSPAQSTEISKRFDTYNTKLDDLASKLEVAQNAILTGSITTAVDNIVVGGRNLAINTGSGVWDVYGAGVSLSTSVGNDGNNITKVVQTTTAIGGIQQTTLDRKMKLTQGDKYILSCEVKSNITAVTTLLNYAYIMNSSGSNQLITFNASPLSATAFTKVTASFTKETNTPFSFVMLSSNGNKVNDWYEVRNVKVEKGNKDTDWSPAPEDITNTVIDLGESLKDFKGVNITAFSDGLISQSEAKAMDVSKSHLERGFKEINSRYTAIYNNTGLGAAEKKELKTSYDLWAGTHTSTLGYISTLVKKGTVSLTESAEVTKRFDAYNTNLDALATKLESAQDSIVKALSAKASSDAVNAISIGGRNLMIMTNHAFDKGKYLTKTGTFTASASWWTSDFIPVTGGKEYITTAVPNPNYNTTVGTCYYDASKVLISCVVGATERRLSTAPATAKFMRMSYTPADFPRLMLEEGNIPSNYAPSPEDVHASALDVGKAFTEFEKDFNESIKDDIITKAEASSLFSLLKVLENESNGLTARKDSLVANSSISADAKTALNTAYTSYDAQYKALSKHMSDSNLAQDLTPARKTAMVTLFNTYKAALSGLTKAIESALDSISATRVESIKLGGRNLLKLSDSKLTNNLYLMNTYTITEAIPANEEVVVTVWGTLGSDRTQFMVYNLAGTFLANLTLVSPGKYQAQFKWKVGGNNLGLRFYQAGSSGTSSSTVNKIQLEKGNIGTDWTIAPEDITDLTIESDNKIKLVTDANSSLTESYNKTTETTTASFKAIQTGENNMLENSGLVELDRAPFLNSKSGRNTTYPGHIVIGGTSYLQVDFPPLVTGTTYTFSYEIARNLVATVVTTSIGTYSSTDTTVNQLASTKHVLTFAAKADTTFARISSASATQVAIITNVKLEKGSIATSGLSGTLIDTIAELKETKKTTTDLKGNVESTWSMEASVNGEISGIYLTKGNKKSDFKVLAENFQVVNDKGSAVVPFRVEGNKAYANDLIVDTANITGSLTVGHLPDNIITLDKLVPADRDKINKASEDIANLEIGGKNLLKDSNTFVDANTNLTLGGVKFTKRGYEWGYKLKNVNVSPGATYTVSALFYNAEDTAVSGRIGFWLQGNSSRKSTSSLQLSPGESKIISHTLTIPEGVTVVSTEALASISGAFVHISYIKVEKGNKATDWTPAPEDVNAAITTVSTSVTDITSDGKVTPNEKRDLLRIKDEIVSTHVELLKSVITVPGATTPTTYTTAYSDVTTRLTNAAKSPTVTTDIEALDRTNLTKALSTYFTERAKLNDTLVTKTKESVTAAATAASTADGKAVSAGNAAGTAQGRADAAHKSLADNVYMPGTTKINGGNIQTGTVTAAQINAAQLKVVAANVTGTLTAAQISTPNLSSLSSNLGAVTAGSINIGGKFIVDSLGNVTARNGTFEGDVRLKNGQVDTLQIAGNAVTVPRYVYIAEEKVSGRPPEMKDPYYPYNKLELGSFTYDAQDSAAVTLYVAIDYIKAGRLANRGDWWVKIHLKKNGNIMHTWTRNGKAGGNTYTYEDFWLNLPPYIDVNPKSGGTISLEAECYSSFHSDSVNVPGFPEITARGVTFGMVGAKR